MAKVRVNWCLVVQSVLDFPQQLQLWMATVSRSVTLHNGSDNSIITTEAQRRYRSSILVKMCVFEDTKLGNQQWCLKKWSTLIYSQHPQWSIQTQQNCSSKHYQTICAHPRDRRAADDSWNAGSCSISNAAWHTDAWSSVPSTSFGH